MDQVPAYTSWFPAFGTTFAFAQQRNPVPHLAAYLELLTQLAKFRLASCWEPGAARSACDGATATTNEYTRLGKAFA